MNPYLRGAQLFRVGVIGGSPLQLPKIRTEALFLYFDLRRYDDWSSVH